MRKSTDRGCGALFRTAGWIVLVQATLAGCATHSIPPEALRLPESSLEIRSVQTRNFSVQSEGTILAASIAVLQDMEYNIDVLEKPLGVVTASKVSDADSSSQKAGLIFLDVLCAAGGSGTCSAYSTADDSQKIIVTLVVLPSLAKKDEFVARVTLQRAVFDKQSRVKLMETINDPELYQQIFQKLSNSIFLQVNE
jgi:hypothetical protein